MFWIQPVPVTVLWPGIYWGNILEKKILIV